MLAAAVINRRSTMRPSDNAPVCSKIMMTIKMVASISRLCKELSILSMRKRCATTCIEEKVNVRKDFLTRQDKQPEKARRKRRNFRLNGRMRERCVELPRGQTRRD